jgi:hypothetical protein
MGVEGISYVRGRGGPEALKGNQRGRNTEVLSELVSISAPSVLFVSMLLRIEHTLIWRGGAVGGVGESRTVHRGAPV